MDNHYHLMIETPDANLSIGMHQLNGIYTQRYNRRHHKPGHVFQGRFKGILIQKEKYLLELCRYVVLNPVRAGLVEKPEAWKWSSYQATTGLRKEPDYLTTHWILGQFNSKRTVAQKQYRAFVREGIHRGSPWNELQGQVLGEEGSRVRSLILMFLKYQKARLDPTSNPKSRPLNPWTISNNKEWNYYT